MKSFRSTDDILVSQVIQKLSDAKLIVTNEMIRQENRMATVEVAHEALIRHWPRLRQWIDENRDAILFERRIDMAARYWESEGNPESLLCQYDSDLARLEAFLQQHKDEKAPLQEFFRKSIEAKAQRERREQQQDQLRQENERRDIQTLIGTSERQFKEHNELEALWSIIKAAHKLKQLHSISINLRLKECDELEALVVLQLREILYNIREKDRFENYPDGNSCVVNKIEFISQKCHYFRGYPNSTPAIESFFPLLASGYEDDKLKIWNVRNRREEYSFLCKSRDRNLSFSLDGKKLIVNLNHEDFHILSSTERSDPEALEKLSDRRTSLDEPTCSTLSPDSVFFIIGHRDGSIRIRKGDKIIKMSSNIWNRQYLPLSDRMITALDVSRDGRMFAAAAGNDKSTIKLWSIVHGRKFVDSRQPIIEPATKITSLSFNHNASVLAVTTNDDVVRLYSSTESASSADKPLSSRCSDEIKHSACVSCVTFSPDGDLLATMAEKTSPFFKKDKPAIGQKREKTVYLWKPAGAVAKVLSNTNVPVRCIKFSPDGKVLVSENEKGEFVFWNVSDGKIFSQLTRAFHKSSHATDEFGITERDEWGFTFDSKIFGWWAKSVDTALGVHETA